MSSKKKKKLIDTKYIILIIIGIIIVLLSIFSFIVKDKRNLSKPEQILNMLVMKYQNYII